MSENTNPKFPVQQKNFKYFIFAFIMLFSVRLAAQTNPFITTWKTDNPGTSNDNQITIPTSGRGYNYDVYWEEIDNLSNNGNLLGQTSGSLTITFPIAGIYRVKIYGDFPRIYFNSAGDREKILTVEQWGDIAWTSMEGAFHGCSHLTLTASDAPDLSSVINMNRMFKGATSFNQNIDHWDVGNIQYMISTFQQASSFNQNIEDWDVSNVINMSQMFVAAGSFNQPIGSWNVSKVTDMESMFNNASSFDQDISQWNVSSVTDMSWMFGYAISFDQNIGSWNMINVTDISGMFAGASSFNQDISAWNVDNVTKLSYTFSEAVSFNQPIGNWNVSNVTAMDGMFSGATSFNGYVGGWDVAKVTKMSWMFYKASSFDQNIGGWDVRNVTNMTSMLSMSGLSNLNYTQTLTGWAAWESFQLSGPLGAHGLHYCDGTARGSLIVDHNWSIVGDSEFIFGPDEVSLPDLVDGCSISMPVSPTATDCEGAVVEGIPDVIFPITNPGTTTITWTYTDSNGNISTQTQNAVVEDSAPVADNESLPDLLGECSIDLPDSPTATDNCDGTITGVPDISFPITTKGTTVITWTFTDSNGNSVAQTQKAIIDDVTSPQIILDNRLADIFDECSVDQPSSFPTAVDNCEGLIIGVPDISFPITAQGTTIITWTFEDSKGNKSTQTQEVIIEDGTAPVPDAEILNDLVGECTVEQPVAPTATDNCEGVITGIPDVAFPITTIGTTVVTWTFEDSKGNISTQTQNAVIDCVTPITGTQENLNDPEVKLYPNPVTNKLNIDRGNQKNIRIELLDAAGNILHSQEISNQTSSLDFSERPAGLYFIRVYNERRVTHYKLVKVD